MRLGDEKLRRDTEQPRSALPMLRISRSGTGLPGRAPASLTSFSLDKKFNPARGEKLPRGRERNERGNTCPYVQAEHGRIISSSREKSAPRAKSLNTPCVRAFVVPEHIEVSIVGQHAEKRRSGRIPFIIELGDLMGAIACGKAQRPLVAAISGVAFHVNSVHQFRPVSSRYPQSQLARNSALYAAPMNTITAVRYIQISSPITAATPP